MNVTIDLPENIAQSLSAKWTNLPRAALESLALEGYRAKVLTTAELQQLLGYDTSYALDGFLKERGVYLDYSADELEREAENSRGLAQRRKSEIESDDRQRSSG
jgi:hypothetical protein